MELAKYQHDDEWCAWDSDCAHLCSMQDVKSKRNPRLVPYSLLDERTKKSNRDSLREAIRTLIGYGYNIEPPDQDGGKLSLPHKPMLTSMVKMYRTVEDFLC